MGFDFGKIKDFATAVAGGDTFDVADITALQSVGQLPIGIDPEKLLTTVNEAKDAIAAGDFTALTPLVSTVLPDEATTSTITEPSAAVDGAISEEDLLVTSAIGAEKSFNVSDEEVTDSLAADIPISSTGDHRPSFKEVFGVGAGLAWDLPEVKFFDKLINKNANILVDSKVKVGAILDGVSENGTLEITFKNPPTDADLVDMFKVDLRFIVLKEGYLLFYVSSDPQLIGECVGSTLYLF